MSHRQDYEAMDMDYGTSEFRRSSATKSSTRRRPAHGRQRGKAPQSVNGIHRRRNRKMNW
jgi:hypothetical protein